MPKLPGINHLQAIRVVEKAGFKVVRQSGHIVLSNNNPINAFAMGGIVKDAGFTVAEFKKYL